MTIPGTLEQALADPVIGEHVGKVLAIERRYGDKSPHYEVPNEYWPLVQDMRMPYADGGVADGSDWFYTYITAVNCLIRHPDTAHMMDLPSDVLVSMMKMGSAPAAVYYPIALAREKLNGDA